MKVDLNSWHCRLYRFHHRMKHGWEPSENHQWVTNLCPYMRTVLFYWWLRFLFINGKIPLTKRYYIPVPVPVIVYLFFFLPGLLGVFSYSLKMFLVTLYVAFAILAGALLFLVTLIWTAEKYKDWKRKHNRPETTGFIQLTKTYARSIHDRICPSIEIVSEEGED